MIRDNNDVSKRLAQKILKISDTNRDGKINYPEFVDMLQNKKFKSVFGRYMNLYVYSYYYIFYLLIFYTAP